jgi:hypothetical protein
MRNNTSPCKRACSRLLGMTMAMLMSSQTHAATTESAVKAGFIYNFSKFIEAPGTPPTDARYNLCITGSSADDSFDALEGKPVGNLSLKLLRNVKPENFRNCQMVFIAETSEDRAETTLKKLETLPVITVSDQSDFINKGGMIGLIRDGNRLGFEINLESANEVGLRFSAQLLKLAKNVKGLKK